MSRKTWGNIVESQKLDHCLTFEFGIWYAIEKNRPELSPGPETKLTHPLFQQDLLYLQGLIFLFLLLVQHAHFFDQSVNQLINNRNHY